MSLHITTQMGERNAFRLSVKQNIYLSIYLDFISHSDGCRLNFFDQNDMNGGMVASLNGP